MTPHRLHLIWSEIWSYLRYKIIREFYKRVQEVDSGGLGIRLVFLSRYFQRHRGPHIQIHKSLAILFLKGGKENGTFVLFVPQITESHSPSQDCHNYVLDFKI